MKRPMKHSLAILLALCLLLSAVPASAAGADAAFDAFLTDWWKKEIQTDYYSLHSAVKDYAAYGLEKPAAELPHVSYEFCTEASAGASAALKELEKFDYDALSRERQRDYDAIEFFLEYARDVNSYPQFQEVFNPYTLGLNGVVTNYFAEYVFYAAEDFPDYLSMLESFPRFVDEAIAMTEKQAAWGYFMPDPALDAALEDIEQFLATGGDNVLLAVFEQKLDAFPGLTDGQRAEYKARNRALVTEGVFPAYEKAAAALEALRGSRKYDGGLCAFPDGDKYYNALARWKTGTRLGPQALKDACAEVGEAYFTLSVANLYVNGVGEDGELRTGAEQFALTEPAEILEYLRAHMDAFPAGPDVNYEVSYLDKSMESPGIAAYYMPTPLDDVTDNVIRVNGSFVGPENANEMYTTLAHEGFAGHLYQITWYLASAPEPARTWQETMNLGYVEGWAQYAAVEMTGEMGLDEFSTMAAAIDDYCGYTLYGELDAAIHGLGYTPEEVAAQTAYGALASMSGVGVEDMYDMIVSMPGTYLPYAYGAVRFEALRCKADLALGDALDPVAFHETLLTGGPRPFETVEKDVDVFILASGGTLPAEEDVAPLTRSMRALLAAYAAMAAEDAADTFADVPEDAWYRDAAYWALENGVTNGVGGNRFGPGLTVTLGQAATFLYRLDGGGGADWYEDAMDWAFDTGLLGDGGADPEGVIDRAGMAKLLYAWARSLGEGFSGEWMFLLSDTYSDADAIPEDAYEAVCWLTMNDVFRGKSGAFDPDGALTRAEAVTLLYRLDGALAAADAAA